MNAATQLRNLPSSNLSAIIHAIEAARGAQSFDLDTFAVFTRETARAATVGELLTACNGAVRRLCNLPESWRIEEAQVERAMGVVNDLADMLA